MSDFHYTPTGTGVISGRQVLQQTEDAINQIGQDIEDSSIAREVAEEALQNANEALALAQSASNATASAMEQFSQWETAIDQASGDSATALAQSATALQQSESALENVNEALSLAQTANENALQALAGVDGATEAAKQYSEDALNYANTASEKADLAKAWAESETSPDGAEDSESPTGETQSARSWALFTKAQGEGIAESINQATGEAIDSIRTERTDAVSAIDSERDSAISTATAQIGQEKDNAIAEIDTAGTTALNQVNTAGSDALAQIGTERQSAITAIGEAQSTATETISGVVADSESDIRQFAETERQTVIEAVQRAGADAEASIDGVAESAQASANSAQDSANLAQAWAESDESPDGEADEDSPTGETMSAKSWAMYLATQGGGVTLDTAQTITGAKTFTAPIVGNLDGTASRATEDASGNNIADTYATKSALQTVDSGAVHIAGAETVTGAKTFVVSPIIPTPETSDNSTKAVNSEWVKAQGYLTEHQSLDGKVNVSGARGTLAGYESATALTGSALTISRDSADHVTASTSGSVTLNFTADNAGAVAVKVISLTASGTTALTVSGATWANNASAPTWGTAGSTLILVAYFVGGAVYLTAFHNSEAS